MLPGELLHFDAGREKSVNALREAMRRDDLIFLSAQRDARKAEITPEDIFETGTLASSGRCSPCLGIATGYL